MRQHGLAHVQIILRLQQQREARIWWWCVAAPMPSAVPAWLW
jgi:hypothetical protein